MTVVTLSASYGAGGSHIGPALAERLGIPFHDRAIPTAVAQRLALTVEEVLAAEEPVAGGISRLIQGLAAVGGLWGAPAATEGAGDLLLENEYRRETGREIVRQAESHGGVFLGRAAALVLRDHDGALHVRLDGPAAARVRQAMVLRGVDRATAEAEQVRNDHAREAYVRHFFSCDPHDPTLYHVVLDTTALGVTAAVDLLAAAVAAREQVAEG